MLSLLFTFWPCAEIRPVSALSCLKPFFSSLEWNRMKVNMKQRDFIKAATFTFTTLPSLKRKRCCLSSSLMCWLSYQRRGLSGQSVPAVRTLPHSYQPLCHPLLTGAWHESVCVCVHAFKRVCVARPPFRWVDGFKEDLYLLSGLIWEILTSSLCTFDSLCSCVVFISW